MEPRLKTKAQAVAKKLGFNLSSVLKGYLVELVKTKRVDFAATEDPSPWLIRQLKQAEKELRERKTVHFGDVENAIRWLHAGGSKRRFVKQYRRASAEVKEKFQSRLQLFKENRFNPVLNNHGLTGKYTGYRSINVTGDWRAIFMEVGETVYFVALGTHSQLYK